MKAKTLILMVVAVVCGLGASYMTSRLLAERDDKPPETPPPEKIVVLVAKNNIGMSTAFKAKPEIFFTEKTVTKEDAPKDALTPADLPKLKGKYLKRSLRKDDHITTQDVLDNNPGLPTLPDGMRAVGIRVNVDQIAGGFASLPGSRVDLIWVTRPGGNNETVAKTLLENVAVLAADTQTNGPEGGGALVASVVTVALDPRDAAILAVAMETGSIRLFVRNLDDKSTAAVGNITYEKVLKGFNKDEPAPPQMATVDPKEHKRDQNYEERGNHPLPQEADPQPKEKPKIVQYKKNTVTVRNGNEVTLHHYWTDENDNIVPNPQLNFDPQENDPVPPPAPPKGKKDDKKTDI